MYICDKVLDVSRCRDQLPLIGQDSIDLVSSDCVNRWSANCRCSRGSTSCSRILRISVVSCFIKGDLSAQQLLQTLEKAASARVAQGLTHCTTHVLTFMSLTIHGQIECGCICSQQTKAIHLYGSKHTETALLSSNNLVHLSMQLSQHVIHCGLTLSTEQSIKNSQK